MIAFLQHRAGELIDDRYLVRRVLGSGAFGTVYLCRDGELDTEVAIKELHVLDDPNSATHERGAALEKFRAEAVNLSRLRHPHIVSGHYEPQNGTWLVCPVCGFTFAGTPRCPEHNAAPIVLRARHYLVMEYLDGPDLDEAARVAGGALPIPQALHYIRPIASALKLIHARGLIHRDIKPENIRLRAPAGASGDDAVLLDFGIAGESGSEGDFGTRVQRHTTGGGTFGYAPDSAAERRHPDARSDIHALGMTLFRLLSGRDPLDDADLSELRRRRPRELNPAISPALESLIARSISSEPNERPKDAAAWLAELENIIAPPPGVQPQSAPHLPAQAFTFRSGEAARDIASLLKLLDSHRAEAKDYLYNGDLAAWLARVGRTDLAARAREVADEYPDRRYQGLEAFAQSAGAPPPHLELWPKTLDFGLLAPDARRAVTVKLQNTGRGHLFGFLRSGDAGLDFESGFEGNRHVVPVALEARALPAGDWRGTIVVDSSAGEFRIPCVAQIRVRDRWGAALAVWSWSIVGAVGGWALRTLPFASQNGAWLDGESFGSAAPSMAAFGAALWALLLVLVVGEAVRRKSWAFFFSSGATALPVAIIGGACALPLLQLGDATLQAIVGDNLQVASPAVWSWLLAGGTVGAVYGTLWRARDVFSARVFVVLLGWLLAAVTFSGALAGAWR